MPGGVPSDRLRILIRLISAKKAGDPTKIHKARRGPSSEGNSSEIKIYPFFVGRRASQLHNFGRTGTIVTGDVRNYS